MEGDTRIVRAEVPPEEVNESAGRRRAVAGAGLGFRGLGFRLWGAGLRVHGLGFGVWGLGFRVEGLGLRVWGLGFGGWGLGCT